MTKSSKKLLAIILSLVMVLACAVTLGLALTPKAEVKADATDYRGKVVIWDYYAANANRTATPYLWATKANATSDSQSAKFVVLKNTTDETIDVSGWAITYFSATSTTSTNSLVFANGTIIPGNGYLFIYSAADPAKKSGNQTNMELTTLPDFIKNDFKTPATYSNFSVIGKGLNTGANGAILLATSQILSVNSAITSLTGDMVDLIGTGSSIHHLGTSTFTVTAGSHLIRTSESEYGFESEANYWNSQTDNSLGYLIGNEDVYEAISDAKAETDPTQDVTIKAVVTHYNASARTYTMQDSTGAMLVTVPEGTTVQTVGKMVLATGKVNSGAMTVESTDNFVPKNNGTVNYASPTLAEILATDSMYDNYCVELKNMSYDSTNHTIGDGTNTLKVDENSLTVSGATISVKGIVRIVESVKTLVLQSAHEYRTFAYGEIDDIRALDQEEYEGINFRAQGFITYAYGTDAYLEDTASGIQLHGTALGDAFSAGDYVIIDGVIGTYNNNIQIDNVTLVSKVDEPTQTPPSIHPLANATEIETYMHRSVSIDKVLIMSVEYASSNMYQVRFGASNQYVTYLNIDNSNALNLEQGDELQVVRGLVFNKKFTFDKTQGAQDVITLKCANTTSYVVVKSNSVQEIIENGTDGQDVLTKGVVTYVDNANSLFVLQYNGYGIVVKVNGGTNREITEISAGQSYKVAGTLTKNATETYITATTLTTRSGSAEAAVDATLADFATHNLQYVNVGTVKVSAVTDTHTYTVTDGTNTATLITAYEKGLHLYDYITVKAVVYNGNLVTSDEADVVNLMIDINTAYSSTAKDKDIYYVRGIVTYIEVDEHNSQEGIENLIIEQILGDGSRIALRAYFGNSTTLPAAGSVSLGDTVTLKGERKTFNGLVELDKTEVLGDIVAGEELDPVAMTIAKVNLQTAVKLYQSLYVKFSQVEIKEIIVDANEDIMVVLTQEGKLLNFYFGMLQDGETVSHAIERVTEYFQGYDLFVGDKADIVGHLNYYKRKVDSVEVGGFRLELHLDGEHQVEDLDPTDYISNQVKTDYTLTYINGQNVVVRQETLKRNANFRTLDVINVPGKVFIGWDDSGVKYNANTNYAMPTHDLTLRATYTDKTYTVTFVTGTEEVINDITGLEYNMRIALPNPAITKTNCTFGGWYMDENYSKAFTANTTITEDTTLYARWREKSTPADGGKSQGGADTTLVVIISVASTLVVVGGGILVVYFIKNKKKK
ncbi:MAG: InlB B-repeat-containing protein [Clostridia bacterium]|nr:InlB B-repeat-containing protein [Clostridia bacterium]